jgi:hypothetical protein
MLDRLTLEVPMLLRSLAFLSLSLLVASASAQTLPVADAGDDAIVDCAPPGGAEVTLDGTGSFDPDDAAAVLDYTWTGDALGAPVAGATPTVLLPPGVHVLTLTVDDGADGAASDEVTIEVIADSTPPELVLAFDEDELWPPNHKLHGYAAGALVESVSDDCSELDADDVSFARGTSDEADEGLGDGNFPHDVVFHDHCTEVELRAERSGLGDGRVYHLFLKVADEAGNETVDSVAISVPHDRAHDAVDSGLHHEVLCERPDCPPEPDPTCDDVEWSSVSMAKGKKGAALRWRAGGFPAGKNWGEDHAVCVYQDGEPAGGSSQPKKVKLKARKGRGALDVGTRGGDLKLPALPLASGSSLRLELHDGEGECVAHEEQVD